MALLILQRSCCSGREVFSKSRNSEIGLWGKDRYEAPPWKMQVREVRVSFIFLVDIAAFH